MLAHRRIVFVLAAVVPLAAVAACVGGNGDPIPNQIFDASALDVGVNPDDPDGGSGAKDGEVPRNDAAKDAPADAPQESGPLHGPVQVSELYVDQIGDGDGTEFVELRAAPGTAMDDIKLRIVYANGLVKYEVSAGLAGDKVGADGLWVVGGAQTFKLNVMNRVDRTVNLTTWGLDVPGAVQVVRGTTLLDVVGYSNVPDGGALAPLSSAPTATIEGRAALAPDNAGATTGTKRKSFGRKTGAVDTNDNAADFCTMEASPGYPQKACQ